MCKSSGFLKTIKVLSDKIDDSFGKDYWRLDHGTMADASQYFKIGRPGDCNEGAGGSISFDDHVLCSQQ